MYFTNRLKSNQYAHTHTHTHTHPFIPQTYLFCIVSRREVSFGFYLCDILRIVFAPKEMPSSCLTS